MWSLIELFDITVRKSQRQAEVAFQNVRLSMDAHALPKLLPFQQEHSDVHL